nr:spore germination protein [Paenibacillus sp. Marseille-Q4541]
MNNQDNKNKSIQQSKSIIPQVFSSISENVTYIEHFFLQSQDLITHRFMFKEKECILFYFETLIDQDKLEQKFFRPLSNSTNENNIGLFTFGHFPDTTDLDQITRKLMNGFAVIYIEGEKHAFLIDSAASYVRSTDEPQNEKIVRGSHQGFVESLNVNLNLIRNKIEDQHLYIQYITIGQKTNTKIAIAYMKGIANEDVVNETLRRLESISVDMLFSSGTIEEFLEDSPSSPFPQMLNTERPDRVGANLMEGRIAILTEGTPTALIVPVNFFSFYQSPDDYSRSYAGTFIRAIRLFSFIVAVTLPAIYIAVIGFHFEILPYQLVITIQGSIEKIPYPPLIEAFIMELTIELIREAGIRLPSAIGPTISIVGGLVIGDAIVKAGLVSNTMIVVVAMTAIASYVVPSNEMSSSIRLLRFPMMFAAAILGFVGIVLGLMTLLIHLCKLESFGSPYFAPIAPFRWSHLKDAIVRVPVWRMANKSSDSRPEHMQQQSASREWEQNDKK